MKIDSKEWANALAEEIRTQAETIACLTEALQQIASSPETGFPADLLKLLAQQALEEIE